MDTEMPNQKKRAVEEAGPCEVRALEPAAGDRVTLNVGGTVFVSTLSTLKGKRGTYNYFDGLLHFREQKGEGVEHANETMFIDRDGTHFRHILNFLRDGKFPEGLDLGTREELAAESDYFQLTDLTQWLRREWAAQHLGQDVMQLRMGEELIRQPSPRSQCTLRLTDDD